MTYSVLGSSPGICQTRARRCWTLRDGDNSIHLVRLVLANTVEMNASAVLADVEVVCNLNKMLAATTL